MLVRPGLRGAGEPPAWGVGLPLALALATSGTLGGLLLPETVGSAKEMRIAPFLRCTWTVMEPLLTSGAAAAASLAIACRPSPGGEYCSRRPGGESVDCAAEPSTAAASAASCGGAAALPSEG